MCWCRSSPLTLPSTIPNSHKRETTLLGSRNATISDFEYVMAAMRAGEVPDALITHTRMNLAQVPELFAA